MRPAVVKGAEGGSGDSRGFTLDDGGPGGA